MPNPADIATSGMMVVLYVAAANFFIKFGLDIFGYGRYKQIVDILAMAFLAGMVVLALKGFMSAADTINQGKWPQ